MSTCPYCQSLKTTTIYDALVPSATFACPKNLLDWVKPLPLTVEICKDCCLGFASKHASDKDLEKIYENYNYVLPSLKIGQGQYERMLALLTKHYSTSHSLVEIGCLDGYLLSKLETAGFKSLEGIEPSPAAQRGIDRGLKIHQGYFSAEILQNRKVDGFYLMHVLEHFPDPFSALRTMLTHLSPSGKIILEVPNVCGFQHEHLFYFSWPFFRRMAKDLALKILDADVDDSTIRLVLSREGREVEKTQFDQIQLENILEKVGAERIAFKNNVQALKDLMAQSAGKTILWWGSGMASVIYLNQLDQTQLRDSGIRIVDGDSNRWGQFIPGPNLLIESFNEFKNQRVDILCIASSFHKEIAERAKAENILVQSIQVFV